MDIRLLTKNRNKKLTKEDLQVLLLFDLGCAVLLLIAVTSGYWELFFGGLAGGLCFNFLFLREYYSKKQNGFSEPD